MLCKIRHFVNLESLRMIYYGIFSSILLYGSQIWGQHNMIVNKLQVLQNKALCIMNFNPPRSSATRLFKTCNILKLEDSIKLQNFLFAHDSVRDNLPLSLSVRLTFVSTRYNTRSETYLQLDKIRTNTILYGSNSIKSKSLDIWNFINKLFFKENLHVKSRFSCKKLVTNFLISKY